MAKSHTTKQARAEFEVQLETLKTASEIVTAYVKRWSKDEIQRLIKNNELPLIPLKDGLQVGRQKIKLVAQNWTLFNDYNEPLQNFTTKKSAALYSLLTQSRRYKSADEILGKDQKVSKLESDFQHYESMMRRAAKRKDYVTIDIIASRYYDAKIVLDLARNDLEKTLRMNKYLKVWEIGKPL